MKKKLAAGVACGGAVDLAGAFVTSPAGHALRGGAVEPGHASVSQQVAQAPQAAQGSSLALGGVALLAAAGAQAGRRKAARRGRKARGTVVPRAGVKEDVDAMIANNTVLVVSKSFCPFCKKTKAALNELGAKYEVLELEDEAKKPIVDDAAAIQDYLGELTGARSVPRVFISGQFVGGADDTLAKKNNGELLQLLQKAGAIDPNFVPKAAEPVVYEPYVADAATLAAAAAEAKLAKVKVGDAFPAGVSLDVGFPPEKLSVAEYCKGKKVVLVGLPGAFTPTCSSTQVPGYLNRQDELKAKGVTDVLVYCVNDGAVMTAWGRDQGVEGSIVKTLGDPRREVTGALGLILDHPGPMSVLGTKRCKRFSMLIDDGIIKSINIAAAEGDPAGDDNPAISLVAQMLNDLS